jgi:TctA family transporter
MEVGMLDAAGQALLLILDPYRLLILGLGVLMGLFLGIMPGIGGVAGMALLLPFTFGLDPYAAFALLLGMAAVTSTGDTIPAVLFGVPGTAGAQATVLDGHPMARKGEAGRALSAAYMSSLIGGLIGALLLGLTIPVLRPIILYLGSPELLAFAIFGISMVAVLSGSAPLRGLTAAGLGILFAMIGSDPQTGTLRWTMGTLYLWDGLPLLPLTLGLFALPELADLAITRKSIASSSKHDVRAGMMRGMGDAFRNWWLIVRCSSLGAALGAIPGLGSAVIDWMAYGHAVRTIKGASETFGTGDVRGVIAPESANNAKEGGSLVPTVAFGVPGSASMAILLGAFLIHGLVPGPEMLRSNLDITYSMVWSIAVANILGAGLCFLFSGYFAMIATLRYTLVLPTVLGILYVGAFQGSRDWGDLYALLFFGLLGWIMKRLRWPRPPLILGFVLGAIIERYMFISITRYGAEWLLRPVVFLLLVMALLGLLRPLIQEARARGGFSKLMTVFGRPTFQPSDLFYLLVIGMIGYMLYTATAWDFRARVAPMIVGAAALVFAVLSFANQILRRPGQGQAAALGMVRADGSREMHMDLHTDLGDLTTRTVLARAGTFFAWLLAFMGSMATIGLIPTIPVFVVAYMRLEGRERWTLIVPQAAALTVLVYWVFHRFLTIPWPATLIGQWFPALKAIPSV